MESDAKLDHRRDARRSGDQQPATRRPMDPGNELEQRALARSIAADQTEHLAVLNADGDAFQRPEFLDRLAAIGMQQAEKSDLQLRGCVVPQEELLRDRL